jgi:hypothetical protein
VTVDGFDITIEILGMPGLGPVVGSIDGNGHFTASGTGPSLDRRGDRPTSRRKARWKFDRSFDSAGNVILVDPTGVANPMTIKTNTPSWWGAAVSTIIPQ